MRYSLIAALLLLAVSAAQGCAQMSMLQSAKLVSSKVKVGMTRSEAIAVLGKPQSTETIGPVEFLVYTPIWYAQHLASSHSPIAILENKVVGIGKAYYDETVQGLSVAQASK